MWLTRLAISRPITVLMALLSLAVLGGISVVKLPLNFLPQAEFPFIGVLIPYPNGIPSQVERELARPVEEILATLGGVKEIFSYSDSDECFVGVEFDWGRDINVLRLEVKEKLDQIRPELPDDVRDILLLTFDTNDIPVVEGRISAKDRDLSGSYDLIERRVIDRLARLPGVGRVEVHGVEPAEVSVYLKLDRIKEFGVDVGALFDDLSAGNFDLTVGQVTQDGLRYTLRTVGSLDDVEDLENLPLDDRGLRLRDIADVRYGTPALTYGRYLNLEPAIAFWVQKSSGANTVEVVESVKEELERINDDPALEGIDVLMFFDQGEQITNSLEGLLQAGTVGAVLAVLVLFFFLRHVGTTLIVALAIPISIVGTACFLFLSHRSLNVLSMMGLMLGVGMLIDNAVVVLESIYRRMSLGENTVEATLNGTRDVGRAVVSATLTSIVVFAPVVFGGRNELMVWLKEVGITISVTLVFSLLVSLTVIPVLTSHLLKGGRRSVGRNPVVDRWAELYTRILRWTAIRHPWITGLPIALAVVLVTVGLIKVTGFAPDPMGEEGIRHEYLQISYDFSDNVSYRVTRDYVKKLQEHIWELREKYEVKYVYSFYQDNYALTRLYFEDTSLAESRLRELRSGLREDLPTLAGVEFRLGDDEGDGGGGAQRFSVTLHGEDSEELARMAREVKRRIALVPEVEDVTTDIEEGVEEVQVRVDPERARRHGVDPATVSQLMGITFRGVQLPRIRTDKREVDLWVLLRPEDRTSLESLKSLVVNVEQGKDITIDQIAATVMSRGADRISRLNQKTAVRVRGSYEGDDFDEVLKAVGATMAAVHFPPGYGWNFGSEIQEARETQNQMAINALLAIACVYMIMASLFESFSHPALVMFCMPFASLGVIWLMIATGTPFNLMAMIGMVILIGIVVNNGIVLVDHINHHRREGLGVDEAILRGGRERFRPILMTATTTVLGLLPLAMGESHVGDAQNYPMARALIGGLLSSTVLTLVMLPTYYQLNERVRLLRGRAWQGLRRAPAALGSRVRRRRGLVPETASPPLEP